MEGKKTKVMCSPPPIDDIRRDAYVYQLSLNNQPKHGGYMAVDTSGALERRRE